MESNIRKVENKVIIMDNDSIDEINPSVESYVIEDNKLEDNNEDNTIIEMFWTSDYNEASENEELLDEPESMMMSKWLFFSDSLDEDMWIMDIQLDMVNFMDYCEEISWEFTGTWELEKCILNEKECFSSTFENWTCEFMEIK